MGASGGPSAMQGGQQVQTPTSFVRPIGGIDFPAADMSPEQTTAPFSDVYTPHELMGSNLMQYIMPFLMQAGTTPPSGLPGSWQGQTQIPTFFNQQGYPYAPPVLDPQGNLISGISTGDVNTNAPNWYHAGQTRKNQ